MLYDYRFFHTLTRRPCLLQLSCALLMHPIRASADSVEMHAGATPALILIIPRVFVNAHSCHMRIWLGVFLSLCLFFFFYKETRFRCMQINAQ